MSTKELSIVVPAYNEGHHLEDVILEMSRALALSGITYEICIVDNGSRDNTAEVIGKLERSDPNITHVHFKDNQRYGGGILAGLAIVRGDVIGWAHADGQADPNDIVRIYRKMRSENRELGKAVRIMRNESPWRKVQGRIWYSLFQILFRSPYRDVNATPRIMTRKAADILQLDSRDWFLEPEFIIKSLRHDIPISEVDTSWHSRRSGSTHVGLSAGLEFLKNLFMYRIGAK